MPVELLRTGQKRTRWLKASPVDELYSLRQESRSSRSTIHVHESDEAEVLPNSSTPLKWILPIQPGKSNGFTLDLRGTKLVYDAAKATLTCKDVTAP